MTMMIFIRGTINGVHGLDITGNIFNTLIMFETISYGLLTSVSPCTIKVSEDGHKKNDISFNRFICPLQHYV